ncbi:MAG: hypothetical protein ACJA2S_004325 [Cyclobacteriaceae bacterium]
MSLKSYGTQIKRSTTTNDQTWTLIVKTKQPLLDIQNVSRSASPTYLKPGLGLKQILNSPNAVFQ